MMRKPSRLPLVLALVLGACNEVGPRDGAGFDSAVESGADGVDASGGATTGSDASTDDVGGGRDDATTGDDASTGGDDTTTTDGAARDTTRPPRPGGGPCEEDDDCGTFQYCEIRFGDGYCHPGLGSDGSACTTNEGCNFADSDDLFCCTNIGYEQRLCMRMEDADETTTCGPGTGRQGDSCVEGGHTDCDNDGFFCIFEGSDYAFCAEFCGPSIGTCDPGTYCLSPNGPWGVCFPPPGDIEEGDRCMDDPFGCDEDLLCLTGGEADEPYAWCAELCRRERDCSQGETCNPFGICEPQGEADFGDPCVEDRFECDEGLACAFAGTRAAECTDVCEEEEDCGDGFFCFIYDGHNGVCRGRGDLENGEFCGDDPSACGGICTGGYFRFDPGGYCLERCATDEDCGESGYCEEFEDIGGYCLPDGEAGHLEECIFDAFVCARGHVCVDFGNVNAFCAARCDTTDDCPAGSWCTAIDEDDFGICYPGGGVEAGAPCEIGAYDCANHSVCAGDIETRCFALCNDDPEGCPEGHRCLEENEGGLRWCFPNGDTAYGESCVDDVYGCAEPYFCGDAWSDQARCTAQCMVDDDCPGADWCFRSRAGGWCRPGGGTLESGESCEGDIHACAEGLFCILGGANGAFCAADCTGFAAECAPTEVCRFVGWGLNFCVQNGDRVHGESCVDNQFACDADHWCVNAATDDAVCIRTCSFDRSACPDGTRCQYLAGGFGVCISAGLSPSDPLNPGGVPL